MKHRHPKGGRINAAQAIQQALQLHRSGNLEAAKPLYESVLRVAPSNPDALHFYGLLHYHQGQFGKAEELIRRALSHAPDYVDALNNLGNILKEGGRVEESEALYRQVVKLQPEHANAYANLGVILKDQGRTDEAVDAYRSAISLLSKSGGADPGLINAFYNLGRLLYLAGRHEEGAAMYERWLAHDPDQPIARHMLAACRGTAPQRASDGYVAKTFDRFAESFDQVLSDLDYQAPRIVTEAMERLFGMPSAPSLDILDAGCGTGLCGPLLRPYAHRLEGVDISSGMLEKATKRGAYDELVQAEITEFLGQHPEHWNVVFSADTLCYFGDLEPVCGAAMAALRPGGWLIFTLERSDRASAPDGYAILPNGRYRHTDQYLLRVLETHGVDQPRVQQVRLRNELDQPVIGWLVCAQKP